MLDAWNAITGRRFMGRFDAEGESPMGFSTAWNVEHWNRIGVEPMEADLLSWRLRKEPIPAGVAAGMVSFVDDEDEKACMEKYYALRGWKRMELHKRAFSMHPTVSKALLLILLIASPWILCKDGFLLVHKMNPSPRWNPVQKAVRIVPISAGMRTIEWMQALRFLIVRWKKFVQN